MNGDTLFDIAKHRIEDCSNNGWDDDPAWGVICACGWETWDAYSEWMARDRHDDHVVEEFNNWRKGAVDWSRVGGDWTAARLDGSSE